MSSDAARCLLIDLFAEEKDIKVVLGVFSHQPKKMKEAESIIEVPLSLDFHEQQICVKDLKVIKKCKCVYKEERKAYHKAGLGTIEIERKRKGREVLKWTKKN